ncbi:unnamed protein product [Caenorhabditis angaria]|uniref:Uncharacterized protein n=1 Tax=Caenorhabditis angaria TaxID=860376 RepID=A0A9P1MW81_9PELO|nr:unnamed protein product [Caenorhabditis angaria]
MPRVGTCTSRTIINIYCGCNMSQMESTAVSTPTHCGPRFISDQNELSMIFHSLVPHSVGKYRSFQEPKNVFDKKNEMNIRTAIRSCTLSGSGFFSPIQENSLIDFNIEVFDRRLEMDKFWVEVKKGDAMMKIVSRKTATSVQFIGKFWIVENIFWYIIFKNILVCEKREDMQIQSESDDSVLSTMYNVNSSCFNTTKTASKNFSLSKKGTGFEEKVERFLHGFEYDEARLLSTPGADAGRSIISAAGYDELFNLLSKLPEKMRKNVINQVSVLKNMSTKTIKARIKKMEEDRLKKIIFREQPSQPKKPHMR